MAWSVLRVTSSLGPSGASGAARGCPAAARAALLALALCGGIAVPAACGDGAARPPDAAAADAGDGAADCQMQAPLPPVVDPVAALDRLGWTKPVAMAETSARSCRTLAWLDGPPPYVVQPPASLATQAFWLDHLLAEARARRFEFFVGSFTRDYQPFGLWLVHQGVFTPLQYSVFNTWPCSGIYDRDGQTKPGVTDIWRDALAR